MDPQEMILIWIKSPWSISRKLFAHGSLLASTHAAATHTATTHTSHTAHAAAT